MRAGTPFADVECRVCAVWFAVSLLCLGIAAPAVGQDRVDVILPKGTQAVWDLGKAFREATPTRERISINGLWRWRPGAARDDAVPAGGWGYFKVPGSWPGNTDYMQKDSQRVHAHPGWKEESISRISTAWYQRDITVPRTWAGRRVTIRVEYLNSYADVFIDGKKAGELRFPGGEIDISSHCRFGKRQVLSLLVVATPLTPVMRSFSDSASVKTVKGRVARRGLCGDVYLVSVPAQARLADVNVRTSVRGGEITFGAALEGPAFEGKGSRERYFLRARVLKSGRTVKKFTSRPFEAAGAQEGRFSFTRKWKPGRLWDIHTPGNQYRLELALVGAGGKILDVSHPVRFGFREFWTQGRDFILNGRRVFLSVVPIDNAQIGAALANYEAARETMERLKAIGINAVYTHNYGCEPGTHLSFSEILRAADDAGTLVFFSQPHFGQYDWDADGAEEKNGYARDAEYYVKAAWNHPCVVMYAMSHNGVGYAEDMNPDLMAGDPPVRDSWSLNNSKRALKAEGIVRRLDPSRIVYHHSAGDFGSLFTINFYANFVPIQEQSDWFRGWASGGKKPMFLCEYGVPLSWDWAMYRGWYKGKREFGSAPVPWEFCQAEWSSQFLGDRAFKISRAEKANLRWEAEQFRQGNVWHRWDYPHRLGGKEFADRHEIIARYATDNLRAFRTLGLSAYCVWDHGHFWKLRAGVDRGRRDFDVDWAGLQRPGIDPDYVQRRYERFDIAFERADWLPTVAGQALIRNNRPLLFYIAGEPGNFTSKDHNFHPGETVEKQIVVMNDSCETVKCVCAWSFGPPKAVRGRKSVKIRAGEQRRIPLEFDLPEDLEPGEYPLAAKVRFSTGETQEDSFPVHVLARAAPVQPAVRIGLFDPKGETARLLSGVGVEFDRVEADADPGEYDMIIVGKEALTVDGPGPDISRVRDGLKVIVFEQSADVMEKRFGFRVAAYGLRQIFARVPDHALLAGLGAENLRDWRGDATLLPPRLEYETGTGRPPTVKWCGIDVTRAWRCGNRGNVASVLVEKPARGDFLPILDGGFSLQYSPLFEYREGVGMILFCQMDVTGRTRQDPAAEKLVRNIVDYAGNWRPAARRRAVVYLGEPEGRRHLEAAGVALEAYDGGPLPAERILVVGAGGGRELAGREELEAWDGDVVAVGLSGEEAGAFLPAGTRMREEEYISAFFEPFGAGSPLAGIGPADVHNRSPRKLSLVTEGADALAGPVAAAGRVVFCQVVPWRFDYAENYGLKRTFRRSSALLARLLGNLGAESRTPLLERFSSPATGSEERWLDSFYLDAPEEWDDPYRFFRW